MDLNNNPKLRQMIIYTAVFTLAFVITGIASTVTSSHTSLRSLVKDIKNGISITKASVK